jgi:hypothetical protein
MIKHTYSTADNQIHAERNDSHMTLCGSWSSDIKPLGASAVTCNACYSAVYQLEREDLHAAIREAGLTVVHQ